MVPRSGGETLEDAVQFPHLINEAKPVVTLATRPEKAFQSAPGLCFLQCCKSENLPAAVWWRSSPTTHSALQSTKLRLCLSRSTSLLRRQSFPLRRSRGERDAARRTHLAVIGIRTGSLRSRAASCRDSNLGCRGWMLVIRALNPHSAPSARRKTLPARRCSTGGQSSLGNSNGPESPLFHIPLILFHRYDGRVVLYKSGSMALRLGPSKHGYQALALPHHYERIHVRATQIRRRRGERACLIDLDPSHLSSGTASPRSPRVGVA